VHSNLDWQPVEDIDEEGLTLIRFDQRSWSLSIDEVEWSSESVCGAWPTERGGVSLLAMD
jgi:hypothetical protein